MKNIPIRSILPEGPRNIELDNFRIFKISEVLLGKNMIQELHRHDFYFILVLTKGIGTHEIDFVKHRITDNSVFIMRPGQVHRFKLKAGSDGYWIAFDKKFQLISGAELLRRAASRNFYKFHKRDLGVLCTILQKALEEYTSRQSGFEFIVKANVETFLIQFLRYRKNDEVASVANRYEQEKLQELMDLLETNIGTKKLASSYADMLSLSPFQLNSITKTLVGKTVTALIEDQILLEAKRHILGTPDQITQIASQLGYEDVSYFIRFFRKKTGSTPDAFRKTFAKSHSTLR